MSRIDVVTSGTKFAVLVNHGSSGRFEYRSSAVANHQAQEIHDKKYPKADLHLIEERKS